MFISFIRNLLNMAKRLIVLRKQLCFLCFITMFVCFATLIEVVSAQIDETPSKSTTAYKVFQYTNTTYTHAESPVWDPCTGTLYWVDVLNQDVHSLEYATNKHTVKHIEYGEVNVILPIANSSRFLVGVKCEVFLLDWCEPGDSALSLVAALDQGRPGNVLNEGKADARGRLWAGTKGPQQGDVVAVDLGALYSLEQPLFTPKVQLKPVSISNGMAWARNNSVFYHVDSATRRIDAYDFDLDNGRISKRRTILNIGTLGFGEAIPDGLTIDKDGMLWVALMFNGSVLRIDPDKRKIIERVKLPVSLATSMTWVGPNLSHLVVTTSRRNMAADQLAKEPLSGSLFFIYHLKTSGLPDNKIIFDNADLY